MTDLPIPPHEIDRADVADSLAARAIADRIAASRHELAQQIVDRCREEIADYRLVDDEQVLADVFAFALDNIEALTAGDGQPTSAARLEPARAAGRRRSHQRISLESFLHAARIWARVVWDAVLEQARADRREELQAALNVAPRLLSQIDEISTVVADAYLDEVSSDRGLLRRDLLDALITGRGDTEIARRRAGALGLHLAENYLVIVLRASGVDPDDAGPQPLSTQVALDRIVHATRGRLHPTAGTLILGMRHGDVVALYPVAGPHDAAEVRRQCAALIDALDTDVAAGIGGWHPGLAATASGYREALDAADIAQANRIRDRPVALDDVLVDHIYRSSPHADRILAETIRPMIDYDRAHQASFVTTLRTYLDAGLNVTRTAKALFVHPNTVEYRLRRIRELSGRDPRNPDDLLTLTLAIKFDELRSSADADRQAA